MPEEDTPKNWNGGEVLFAGGTDWATIGKAPNKKRPADEVKWPDLHEPHRLKSLLDVKIRSIAAGPSACHCMALDINGLCYTWGRNDAGQLGHGDTDNRAQPTVLEALSEMELISGSCGKSHTVFVMENELSYACGSNASGQCGIGELKIKGKNHVLTPIQALVTQCRSAVCGADFTIWLCDGKLYAAGSPQYGVLGDGSSHEYNLSENSVKMAFDPEPTPKRIEVLENREITQVVAGSHHIMAVDSDGIPYTWGNGNYGRLGHAVQQDEWRPRPIESFLGRVRIDHKKLIMAAGGMTTFCTAAGGMLYSWGNRKPTSSDCEMYPHPLIDLQGWMIRDMSCGPGTFAVAAERSVVLWGQGKNGELAKGPSGKRSCANPEKCDALEGFYTHQVACGHGFTLFLVDPDDSRLKDFSIFDPVAFEEAEMGTQKVKGQKKRAIANSDEENEPEKPIPKKKKASRKKRASRGRKRGTKK